LHTLINTLYIMTHFDNHLLLGQVQQPSVFVLDLESCGSHDDHQLILPICCLAHHFCSCLH